MVEWRDGGPVWWGVFSLPENSAGRWRVGALSVWIERRPGEWRVAHASTNDPFDGGVEIDVPSSGAVPAEGVNLERFGLQGTRGPIRLTPVVPDRPVVSRPVTPFYILAEEEFRIYVTSPVWVRIEAETPPRHLVDLPVYRSSDTWFGPSTREGEMCYAGRTSLRQHLDDLPVRSHRVITPVRIRNRTASPLLVERLNLPVPFLSLSATPDGSLWTPPVTFETSVKGDTAEIHVGKGAPEEARDAKLVSGPRDNEGRNILVRALGALIG